MKTLAMLTLLSAVSISPALAGNFTCLRDHEETGAQKVDAALKQGVANVLRRLNITLKDGSLRTTGTFTYHYEEERTDKWVTHAALNWEGSATTAAGTELELFLKSADHDESGNFAFFLPVLKSKGFDREGNPIEPHCNLSLSSPFVANRAKSVGVRNARSGKMIAVFPLPATIAVY